MCIYLLYSADEVRTNVLRNGQWTKTIMPITKTISRLLAIFSKHKQQPVSYFVARFRALITYALDPFCSHSHCFSKCFFVTNASKHVHSIPVLLEENRLWTAIQGKSMEW